MAGRPRSITDDRLFAALATAVETVGPARLTLAHVAKEAGVSTGTLVQRFGSKRGMLLAFLRANGAGSSFVAGMRAAYDAAPDPVAGLVAAVVHSVGGDLSPERFANHLAFLHLELADPPFREALADHAVAVRAEITDYVRSAVAAGLLATDDPEGLAAAVDALRNGTQLTWAMRPTGSLTDALRRDLTTLLAPYRTTKGQS